MIQRNDGRRTGFTLIELLVVMTILALLVALLSAGVFKVLQTTANVKNTREIRELRTGIVNFEGKYKVEYVPSALVLCSRKDDYYSDPPADTTFKSQLHRDSFEYLGRVWRQLDWTTPHGTWTGIDWNASGAPVVAQLEGHQCLVFFLGGIQVGGECIGFSTNQRNPAAIGGDRVEPFFDFKPQRLTTKFPPANGFASYLDAYEKAPFAYFASYKKANGYGRYGGSDCPSLTANAVDATGKPIIVSIAPYVSLFALDTNTNSPTYNTYIPFKYQNSDTFQIVSAGRNGLFGPGGSYWTGQPEPLPSAFPAPPPATIPGFNGQTAESIAKDGRDDWSDFYDRMLGVSDK
jgi:prepilin-type N-terminal cleavage/methylation domain-containing protein